MIENLNSGNLASPKSGKISKKRLLKLLLVAILILTLLIIGIIVVFIAFNQRAISLKNIPILKNILIEIDLPEVVNPPFIPNNPTTSVNREYISHPDYPFDLPTDGPFNFEEMEILYENALKRYSVSYSLANTSINSQSRDFESTIEPYVKLYLASSEYSFEKYGDVFMGENPKMEDRQNLTIRIYEKCTDLGMGLTEESCKDVKLAASASPFTYGVSFYANWQHPDFHSDFLIIVGMHEAIHILQYTYSEDATSTLIPSWYKESMAESLAWNPDHKKDLYPELFEDYTYPATLDDLAKMYSIDNSTIENVNNKRRAYVIGAEFFNYLMTKTTLEKYLTLIPMKTKLSDNEFEREFKNLFGYGSADMYKEFLGNRE